MFRKILLLATGNVTASALLFLRNIVVARLISPEDYGIAATFAMVMSVVEMASQISMHQLIVQDDEGDDPALQASLQGFHLLRITGTSVIMLIVAGALARFMGIPDLGWAFQVLALPRFVQGLLHFDIYRMQRSMSYRPLMAVYVFTPALGLALIFPLVWWFGDYRVMLYSIVFQEIGRTAISHMVANRPYRLAFDISVFRRAFHFGWPLLLNSILMFFAFNGEKVIVGREMGMAQLAPYAMAVTLTLTPALLFSRVLEALFVPRLSALKNDPARFTPLAYGTMQATIATGLLTIALAVGVFAPLTPYVLGERYASMIPLLYWLSLLQALRDAKAVSLVSLARARTRNDMMTNVFRVGALPIAWWAAVQGAGPLVIIWIAIPAELLAMAVGLHLIRSTVRISIRPLLPGYAVFLVFLALFGLHLASSVAPGLHFAGPMVTVTLALLGFGASLASLTWLWQLARRQVLRPA